MTHGSTRRATVQIGDRAPDFILPDQTSAPVRLWDRVGTAVIVLYFYPKDNSAVCTAQACAFRDRYTAFSDAGADVIGVSDDPPEIHRAFAARHRLPFLLLSDTDGAIRSRYGAQAVLGLMKGRVTFVIDREGIVRQRFEALLESDRHVTAALQTLDRL